ncbi:sigma-70 family RNA polymerase sigma factor [Micromonospora sp. NPDC049751]|uniref:sigma-70 family RNA polymerase sigma factor n=1 Tax=Micromonospora sp. NPDC049751 TaxID=3154837 RepID=UPI0034075096
MVVRVLPVRQGRRSVSAVHNEALGPWAGDSAASGPSAAEALMRQIFEEHRVPLLRFLTRLVLGQRELAEDLVQETFLRTWRNLDMLATDPQRIAPWLYTVARHVAIDAIRSRQSRPQEINLPDLNRVSSAEDVMDRVVSNHTVQVALKQISPEHRQVLIEMYYKGASIAEAAERLGIPEGTVKSRTYYAVRALHAAIGSTESS